MIPKIRINNDIRVKIDLTTSLAGEVSLLPENIKAIVAFNDTQRCKTQLDVEYLNDTLYGFFPSNKQCYLGKYRIIVYFNDGNNASWDDPAFELVNYTTEADTEVGLVIVELKRELEVISVDSLYRIISELEMLAVKPAYIGENGNWYTYDVETKTYKDSGVHAQGPQGDTTEADALARAAAAAASAAQTSAADAQSKVSTAQAAATAAGSSASSAATSASQAAASAQEAASFPAAFEDGTRIPLYSKSLEEQPITEISDGFIARNVGEGCGVREARIKQIGGNSVVWNQLFINSATTSKSENGINATIADGVWTLNGTATAGVVGLSLGSVNIIGGHRYAVLGKGGIEAYIESNSSSLSSEDMVFTASTSGNALLYVLQISSGTTLNNVEVRPRITDLTQMFGAGNEPSTYEEFLRRKPSVADEYAYNEGEIVSSDINSVSCCGRNLWDEEARVGRYDRNTGAFVVQSGYVCNTHPIAVIENVNYYINKVVFRLFYDESMTFISADSSGSFLFRIPTGAKFMNIYNDIAAFNGQGCCINLSDPTFNGQYEPYEVHTADIDVQSIVDGDGNKVFPLGLCSVGDVHDEIDLTRRKAVKRMGVVDLGDLEWTKQGTRFAAEVEGIKSQSGWVFNANLLCAGYSYQSGGIGQDAPDGVFAQNGNRVFFGNTTASSASAFKTAMSGVMLCYELATPIEYDLPSTYDDLYFRNGYGMEMLTFNGDAVAPSTFAIEYAKDLQNAVLEHIHDHDRYAEKRDMERMYNELLARIVALENNA